MSKINDNINQDGPWQRQMGDRVCLGCIDSGVVWDARVWETI